MMTTLMFQECNPNQINGFSMENFTALARLLVNSAPPATDTMAPATEAQQVSAGASPQLHPVVTTTTDALNMLITYRNMDADRITAVREALVKYAEDAKLQTYGLTTLFCATAQTPANRERIGKQGINAAIGACRVHGGDLRVAMAAVQALLCLSIGNKSNYMCVLESGNLRVLLQLMRRDSDPAVQDRVLAFVGALADHSDCGKEALIKAGCIKAIAAAMRDSNDTELLCHGVCVLEGTVKAHLSREISTHVVKEGAADAVLRAMLACRDDTHLEAVATHALMAIVYHHQGQQGTADVLKRVMHAVISVTLATDSDQVLVSACLTLSGILLADDPNPDSTAPMMSPDEARRYVRDSDKYVREFGHNNRGFEALLKIAETCTRSLEAYHSRTDHVMSERALAQALMQTYSILFCTTRMHPEN